MAGSYFFIFENGREFCSLRHRNRQSCLPNWFSQTVFGLYIVTEKICACQKNLRLQTKKEIYFFLKHFSVFDPFLVGEKI
jgi:hypothetical protein